MAAWPTSVAGNSDLYLAVNELQTNLSSGINNSVTTITLNSTTGFPTVGLVLIDNEIIKYTGIAGSDLTGCTRAFDGTTAASHSAAAIVSFAICAAHHNVIKDEIIAIENSLNLTASKAVVTDSSGRLAAATTTAAELGFVAGVTSAIQTQINAKGAGTVTNVTGTTNQITVATGTSTPVIAIASPLTLPGAVTAGGAIAMGTNKITGMGSGTASKDAVTFDQIFTGFQAQVQGTSTTIFSTTSSAYQLTNLSATITPTSASHRIKISVYGFFRNGAVQTADAFLTLERSGADLGQGTNGFARLTAGSGTGNLSSNIGFTYIDSPATTSAVTYAVYIKNSDNATTISLGVTEMQVIVLEEIV